MTAFAFDGKRVVMDTKITVINKENHHSFDDYAISKLTLLDYPIRYSTKEDLYITAIGFNGSTEVRRFIAGLVDYYKTNEEGRTTSLSQYLNFLRKVGINNINGNMFLIGTVHDEPTIKMVNHHLEHSTVAVGSCIAPWKFDDVFEAIKPKLKDATEYAYLASFIAEKCNDTLEVYDPVTRKLSKVRPLSIARKRALKAYVSEFLHSIVEDAFA